MLAKRGRFGKWRRVYVVLTDDVQLSVDAGCRVSIVNSVVRVRSEDGRISLRVPLAVDAQSGPRVRQPWSGRSIRGVVVSDDAAANNGTESEASIASVSTLRLSLRIDDAAEFEQWADALKVGARWSVTRFYDLHPEPCGSGTHGVVFFAWRNEDIPERPWFRSSDADAQFGPLDSEPANDGRYPKPPQDSTFRIRERESDESTYHSEEDDDALDQQFMVSSPPRSGENQEPRGRADESRTGVPVPPLPPFVVKAISKSGKGVVTASSELLAARRYLRHFAIVRVHDVFESPTHAHIVFENVPGPNLHDLLFDDGPLYEFDAMRILKAMVKAVGYMHSRGIAHWDIRASNIMLTNRQKPFGPKLIDFGTAVPISTKTGKYVAEGHHSNERGVVSSLQYASPELLCGKGRNYANMVDCWQLGMLLYTMLFADLPFSRPDRGNPSTTLEEEAQETILSFSKMRYKQRSEFLFGPGRTRGISISDGAKTLILALLCPNPKLRMSPLEALRSSFLV